MSITRVQTTGVLHTGFAASGTRVVPSVVAGNSLILYAVTSASLVSGSVTDDKGNTWVNLIEFNGGASGVLVGVWWVLSAAAGTTTITIDPSGGGDLISAVAREVSGLTGTTGTPVGRIQTSATAIVTNVITTTDANALLCAVVGHFTSTAPTITESGLYNLVGENEDGGSGCAINAIDLIVSSTGTFSGGWTMGSATTVASVIVAFKGTPPPPTETTYEHARSNVCRAGVAVAGLAPYRLRCTIGGVERGMQIQGFSVTHTLGQASSCSVRTTGFSVAKGQEIRIADDGVQNLIFGGTIMKRRRPIQSGGPVIYELLCADWIWLMNKDARVFERFDNVGANTAVRRILSYCDPTLAIRPGSIPQALGNVTVTCEGDTVWDAIGRVAKAANAYVHVTPMKAVDLFQDQPPNAQTLLLHDAGGGVKNLIVEDFLDQVRNRVWYAGGGAQATGVAPAGGTAIGVEECGWFATSGTALADGMPISYTGRSVGSGPGSLTGVSGLTRDVPLGALVQVLVKVNDATRQTALAAVLGGGLTGVAIYYQADRAVSVAEATGRANQHLQFYGDAIDQIMCTVDDHTPGQREWEAGRLVDVDVEDDTGESTTGTFRIASVVIHGRQDTFAPGHAYGTRSLSLERDITLRPGMRQSVVDLLVDA
jgi:hypothetical protein